MTSTIYGLHATSASPSLARSRAGLACLEASSSSRREAGAAVSVHLVYLDCESGILQLPPIGSSPVVPTRRGQLAVGESREPLVDLASLPRLDLQPGAVGSRRHVNPFGTVLHRFSGEAFPDATAPRVPIRALGREPPRLLPRREDVRPLALALLLLLLAPVEAAGMNQSERARVRVLWNSTPDGVRAPGTWDARLSLLEGPGGFDPGSARPVIVITEVASGAEQRLPMIVDVPPNTFRATVEFPRAGLYDVAAMGFDPRDPKRVTDLGARVRVGPAPARGASGTWWSWALFVTAVLAGGWCIQRVRARAGRRRP